MPLSAKKTKSYPGFIFISRGLIASLNLLFILLRTTAFFEIFCPTAKPILFSFKLFLNIFKIKKFSFRLFPFLITLSKSFFFFNLYSFDNTLIKKYLNPNFFCQIFDIWILNTNIRQLFFFSFFSFGEKELFSLTCFSFFLKIHGSFSSSFFGVGK